MNNPEDRSEARVEAEAEVSAAVIRAAVEEDARALTREIYLLAGGCFEDPAQPIAEFVYGLQNRVGRLRKVALSGAAMYEVGQGFNRKVLAFSDFVDRIQNRYAWAGKLLTVRQSLHDSALSKEIIVLSDLLRIMSKIVSKRLICDDLTGNRKDLIHALREFDNGPSKFDNPRYFGSALNYLVERKLLSKRTSRECVTLYFSEVEECPPECWMAAEAGTNG